MRKPLSQGLQVEMIDWFEAGWKVYKDGERDSAFFPPLGHREAQRAWLGGFGAAWAANLDDDRAILDALARALVGRAVLLRQLRSHTSGERVQTLH